MPRQFDPHLLQGRWLHAHEEDAPGHEVFRPATHPLPPARGRSGYEFLPDGRLARIGSGPTDRSTVAEGTWTVDPDGRLRIRVSGQPEDVLEISELTGDRLIVKKM